MQLCLFLFDVFGVLFNISLGTLASECELQESVNCKCCVTPPLVAFVCTMCRYDYM